MTSAKSKVFSRQKSHLNTAVICNWICLSSRKSNKTFRLSFTFKGYFLQPKIRKTILKGPSFWTIVTNHWICTTEMSSTQVVALVRTSTSPSSEHWFPYGLNIVWYRGIRCAYWDHKEKKQKVFVTPSFLHYPKFSRFQCEPFL